MKFLPVYDNLLRALAMEGAENDPYRKGVELTMNQLNVVFEEMGIKEIRTLGEKFDPNLHCAVFHVEDSEKGEGEIVEELQKGFTLGDRVIRFSVVKVAN